jgi:hypothetical protein
MKKLLLIAAAIVAIAAPAMISVCTSAGIERVLCD